jgi:hypothetical protein
MDTITVFQDELGEWRWHRKAANGRIISDSGEGYIRRSDVLDAVYRSNGDNEYDLHIDKDPSAW